MKKIFLSAAVTLLFTVSAFSQQRARYFDNFDTGQGVRVDREENVGSAAGGKKKPSGAAVRSASTPKLPSAPVRSIPVPARAATDKKLVRKTAQVTMTVYEGVANLEVVAPRPVTTSLPVAATRMTMESSRMTIAAASRMTMEAGKHLKGYSTGDGLVDSYIVDSSRRYNIDPLLIYAQMAQESSFKRRATSYKGASGLMQLMPATARRLGVTNIYDPKQNIEGGVKYMRILLDMFAGDVRLALAGYNAGEGAVIKYGYQIPPYNETRDYVRRISSRYSAITGKQ